MSDTTANSPNGAPAAAEPADDLKVVLGELSKVGITGVRQVGQALVNTTGGGMFEISCVPMLEEVPATMKISGALEANTTKRVHDSPNSAKQTDERGCISSRCQEGYHLGQAGHFSIHCTPQRAFNIVNSSELGSQ